MPPGNFANQPEKQQLLTVFLNVSEMLYFRQVENIEYQFIEGTK